MQILLIYLNVKKKDSKIIYQESIDAWHSTRDKISKPCTHSDMILHHVGGSEMRDS